MEQNTNKNEFIMVFKSSYEECARTIVTDSKGDLRTDVTLRDVFYEFVDRLGTLIFGDEMMATSLHEIANNDAAYKKFNDSIEKNHDFFEVFIPRTPGI